MLGLLSPKGSVNNYFLKQELRVIKVNMSLTEHGSTEKSFVFFKIDS